MTEANPHSILRQAVNTQGCSTVTTEIQSPARITETASVIKQTDITGDLQSTGLNQNRLVVKKVASGVGGKYIMVSSQTGARHGVANIETKCRGLVNNPVIPSLHSTAKGTSVIMASSQGNHVVSNSTSTQNSTVLSNHSTDLDKQTLVSNSQDMTSAGNEDSFTRDTGIVIDCVESKGGESLETEESTLDTVTKEREQYTEDNTLVTVPEEGSSVAKDHTLEENGGTSAIQICIDGTTYHVNSMAQVQQLLGSQQLQVCIKLQLKFIFSITYKNCS